MQHGLGEICDTARRATGGEDHLPARCPVGSDRDCLAARDRRTDLRAIASRTGRDW